MSDEPIVETVKQSLVFNAGLIALNVHDYQAVLESRIRGVITLLSAVFPRGGRRLNGDSLKRIMEGHEALSDLVRAIVDKPINSPEIQPK